MTSGDTSGAGKAVLILGNGISRLSYQGFIDAWAANKTGELWAANYAFRELGGIIDRIAGHKEAMVEAAAYRDEHGYSYEIWGGNTGRALPGSRVFTVGAKWLRDTGSTLVAQALHEGFDRVVCCGYDFGGPDILSPGLWRQEKKNWIERWQEIYRTWGFDRIEFVGYDHRDYIVSAIADRRRLRSYSSKYLRGLPHIDLPEYIEEHAKYMAEHGVIVDPEKRRRAFDMSDFVKVKWVHNGIVSRLNKRVAQIYLDRGKVQLLEDLEEAVETADEVVKSVGAVVAGVVGAFDVVAESVSEALGGENRPEAAEPKTKRPNVRRGR